MHGESLATVEVPDIQSIVWYTASSLPHPVISVVHSQLAVCPIHAYELQCPIIWEEHMHTLHDTHGLTKTVLM